jgi:hypothetical protein
MKAKLFILIGAGLLTGNLAGCFSKSPAGDLEGLPAGCEKKLVHGQPGAGKCEYDGTSIDFKLQGEGFDPAVFDKMQKLNLDAFYNPTAAPYPGVISTTINCGESYKPKDVTLASSSSQFVGQKIFANSRHQIGACGESDVKFVVFQGRLSCLNKNRNFKFELSLPMDKENLAQNIVQGLQCP